MAYDVYITRATHHYDGAQVPIAEADWRAIVEDDPDLRAPDEALPSYAVWVGAVASGPQWIDWANGNLFTRNPDSTLLGKLYELAELLGATLQGPRGEIYEITDDGELLPGPAPAEEVDDSADSIAASDALLRDLPERPVAEPRTVGAPSAERMFGPRPRNAHDEHGIPTNGSELHADASFVRRPEDRLAGEAETSPKVGLPFSVGQRVRTGWGQPATVISIDPKADSGLGKIEIRYRDGRVAAMSCVSHGLSPLEG